MHKQNLSVRQELGADPIAEVACYHVTQCDDAPMVPKSHHAFVLPMELQRSAVGCTLNENPNGRPNAP